LVLQTAPFLGIISKESAQSDLPSLKDVLAQTNELIAGPTGPFTQLAAKVDELYQPRNTSVSLLNQFFKKFNTILDPVSFATKLSVNLEKKNFFFLHAVPRRMAWRGPYQ